MCVGIVVRIDYADVVLVFFKIAAFGIIRTVVSWAADYEDVFACAGGMNAVYCTMSGCNI